jgi:2-haloacid dehalogenase
MRQEAAVSIFVFDAYGTLFDVHAAIARHRAATGPCARGRPEIWRAKQLEYTWTLRSRDAIDFWTLTERALDFALARAFRGRAAKAAVSAAYQTLDAYPDARAALRELKSRGRRTAILSNGTPASCGRCSRRRAARAGARRCPFGRRASRLQAASRGLPARM